MGRGRGRSRRKTDAYTGSACAPHQPAAIFPAGKYAFRSSRTSSVQAAKACLVDASCDAFSSTGRNPSGTGTCTENQAIGPTYAGAQGKSSSAKGCNRPKTSRAKTRGNTETGSSETGCPQRSSTTRSPSRKSSGGDQSTDVLLVLKRFENDCFGLSVDAYGSSLRLLEFVLVSDQFNRRYEHGAAEEQDYPQYTRSGTTSHGKGRSPFH